MGAVLLMFQGHIELQIQIRIQIILPDPIQSIIETDPDTTKEDSI
jgi:hypothetical protein